MIFTMWGNMAYGVKLEIGEKKFYSRHLSEVNRYFGSCSKQYNNMKA